MEKLNELAAALYPQYGTPGSRDVDVTERRKAIDESAAAIAEAFRALERTADTNMAAAQTMRDEMYRERQRAEAAEAKLAAKPSYFLNRIESSDKWGPEVELRLYENHLDAMKSQGDHGGGVIELFTRPAPAVSLAELVPDEMPTSHIYHGGSGAFNAGKESGWNDCRAAILRKIEEANK